MTHRTNLSKESFKIWKQNNRKRKSIPISQYLFSDQSLKGLLRLIGHGKIKQLLNQVSLKTTDVDDDDDNDNDDDVDDDDNADDADDDNDDNDDKRTKEDGNKQRSSKHG